MYSFKIHDQFIDTHWGQGILMNLRPELSIYNDELNLAERMVSFLETKSLTRKLIISPCLIPYFQRLKLEGELILFPDSIDDFFRLLEPEPCWVLSASKDNKGFIACLINDEPEFKLVNFDSQPVDIMISGSSTRPLTLIESFDLNRSQFTREQQFILALNAMHSVRESEHFAANQFALVFDNKQYYCHSEPRSKLKFSDQILDYSSYYYLDEPQKKHLLWNEALIKAQLREETPSFYRPDYTAFKAWAEDWLINPEAAVRKLDEIPPSPFLFQALALHGDPKLFASHADKIVSINTLDIREAMDFFFDECIQTRPGLSEVEYDFFMAYEPAHIRTLCEQLSGNPRVRRIQEGVGLAVEFMRRALTTPAPAPEVI